MTNYQIPSNMPDTQLSELSPQIIETYVLYEALSIINMRPSKPIVNVISVANDIIQDMPLENILNPLWFPSTHQDRN